MWEVNNLQWEKSYHIDWQRSIGWELRFLFCIWYSSPAEPTVPCLGHRIFGKSFEQVAVNLVFAVRSLSTMSCKTGLVSLLLVISLITFSDARRPLFAMRTTGMKPSVPVHEHLFPYLVISIFPSEKDSQSGTSPISHRQQCKAAVLT